MDSGSSCSSCLTSSAVMARTGYHFAARRCLSLRGVEVVKETEVADAGGSLQDRVARRFGTTKIGGRLGRIHTDGVTGLLSQLQLLAVEEVLRGSQLVLR